MNNQTSNHTDEKALLNNIDYLELKKQKKYLLSLPTCLEIEGLLALIDSMQDYAVDALGKDENIVFDTDEEVDFIMIPPTKRKKALIYMQQYVQSFPDTVIDDDWMYQISIGEHTPTLDSLITLLGSVDAIAEYKGQELRFVIGGIKS